MKTTFAFALTSAALCAASLLTATPVAAQAAFTAAGSTATCDPQKTNTSGAYTSTTSSAFGQVTCSTSGVTVVLQAWSASSTTTSGFTQGNLGDFNGSGFGAFTGAYETNASSQHAFDNMTSGCGTTSNSGSNYTNPTGTAPTTAGGGTVAGSLSTTTNAGCGGAVEALLMNFGTSKVALSRLSTGFTGVDGDLSVYVWTGGATGPSMASQSVTNSAATGLAGWTLVGSNDMGGSGPDGGVNPFLISGTNANIYSSYFLVTTYFGATAGSFDIGNDAFKINGWTANTCAGTVNASGACSTIRVPEPGSLALAGLALVGVFASRRKVKALF